MTTLAIFLIIVAFWVGYAIGRAGERLEQEMER
jgi:hypothetical protein